MNNYLLIGAFLACIATYFFAVEVTDTKWEAKTGEAINQAVKKARADEKIKQEKINETIQTQLDSLSTINDELNSDLIGLRKREGRRNLSGNSKANCKGASGAELSKPDAEFLTREASRADRIRTALIACYSYSDSLQ